MKHKKKYSIKPNDFRELKIYKIQCTYKNLHINKIKTLKTVQVFFKTIKFYYAQRAINTIFNTLNMACDLERRV